MLKGESITWNSTHYFKKEFLRAVYEGVLGLELKVVIGELLLVLYLLLKLRFILSEHVYNKLAVAPIDLPHKTNFLN